MKEEINHYLSYTDMPKPRTEKNNLNYCTSCEKVYETFWGFHYGSQERKHHDMPTYGIERKTCKECNENNKEEYARRESSQTTTETCIADR